jgi:hypothetical protein
MSFFGGSNMTDRKEVEALAKRILGSDTKLGVTMLDALGKIAALRILRSAATKIKNHERRKKYVLACIKMERRKAELERQICEWCDPFELMGDEPEKIGKKEMAAHLKKREAMEEELSMLEGKESAFGMLQGRVGTRRSVELVHQLLAAVSPSRACTIARAASRVDVKHPDLYIRRALENQRRRS